MRDLTGEILKSIEELINTTLPDTPERKRVSALGDEILDTLRIHHDIVTTVYIVKTLYIKKDNGKYIVINKMFNGTICIYKYDTILDIVKFGKFGLDELMKMDNTYEDSVVAQL